MARHGFHHSSTFTIQQVPRPLSGRSSTARHPVISLVDGLVHARSRADGKWKQSRWRISGQSLSECVTAPGCMLRRDVTAWTSIIINVYRHCYVVTARRPPRGCNDGSPAERLPNVLLPFHDSNHSTTAGMQECYGARFLVTA